MSGYLECYWDETLLDQFSPKAKENIIVKINFFFQPKIKSNTNRTNKTEEKKKLRNTTITLIETNRNEVDTKQKKWKVEHIGSARSKKKASK